APSFEIDPTPITFGCPAVWNAAGYCRIGQPWFPEGQTTTVLSASMPPSASSNVQLAGPDGSVVFGTTSALGRVGNAKPTLITWLRRCCQSERATDASVGIGVSASARTMNAPLWSTTVIDALGQACAITPATKSAWPTRASRAVSRALMSALA